ncbi:hypothetical protein J4Q44_G00091720 [Coregonus suidteri]|uniref:Uncharacterized protein n=1 Tax=Coregonus suidteri TaxID=861788 RepID=A0AAN8M944_9TELE
MMKRPEVVECPRHPRKTTLKDTCESSRSLHTTVEVAILGLGRGRAPVPREPRCPAEETSPDREHTFSLCLLSSGGHLEPWSTHGKVEGDRPASKHQQAGPRAAGSGHSRPS